MTGRPTGAVTFLFTDVEGSTALWEAHPDAMRDALAHHDSLLREAIASHDGYVFSTAGDAFSAAFDDPAAAIVAAAESQTVLQKGSWGDVGPLNVRMAIHSGVAHERDGDYFGPALNRTARILSTAHGGQVLVSAGTHELVDPSRLPEGEFLRDLGEHQLKDLGRSERLFQLAGPGLRDDFPPILSLNQHPNNLPVQLTSFVGRRDELRDVVKRLADNRLLTLTGVGGSGKTRLALQAAAESVADYRHGVWLVELASLADADLVSQAIAETLGLTRNQTTPGAPSGEVRPALDQLVEYLESRQVLLILDNCEHLIAETAEVAARILRRCPDVSVLATSREGLGVPGEALWQVPSLRIGGEESPVGDAALLFAERAAASDPGFALDSETLPHVEAICRRLDGMPLAIELAAARTRILSVSRIAERLDDRFRLLTGGSRTALPRQQTLQATVDWSYELLEEREQVVFARLAAFRGGFTLEAAERVVTGGEVDQMEVLDLLGQLVDKSMVTRDEGRDRFHMLETLRQYALEKLSRSAEVDEVRLRHAETFLAVAEKADAELLGPGQVEWLDLLEADHDNLRAALSFCLDNGHEDIGVRIASHLEWYWQRRGHLVEAVEWQERCLPHLGSVDPGTGLRLRCALAADYAWLGHGEYPARAVEMSRELVAEAEEMGDPWYLAKALASLSISLGASHDPEGSMEAAQRGRDAYAEAGDEWGQGCAAFGEAWGYRLQARVPEALVALDRAATHLRRAGDATLLAWVLSARAIMARYRLEFEDEIRLMEEAGGLFEQLGIRGGMAFTSTCKGISLFHLGRFDEALEAMEKGLRLTRDQGVPGSDAETVGLLAEASYAAGDGERLGRYLPETFESTRLAGDPMMLAQNLEFLALMLADAGHPGRAGRIIGYSELQRGASGRPVPPPNRSGWEALQARIAEALGDRFEAEKEVGAAMDFETALGFAFEGVALIV